MRVLHGVANPGDHVQPLARVQTMRARVHLQGLAVDELHREVRLDPEPGVSRACLVNLRNPGMLEPSERLRLPLEAAQRLVGGQAGPDDFERHLPARLLLLRLVDGPHAALAHQPHNPIRPIAVGIQRVPPVGAPVRVRGKSSFSSFEFVGHGGSRAGLYVWATQPWATPGRITGLISKHQRGVDARGPAGGSGGCQGGNGDQQEGGAAKRERIERGDLEQHATHEARRRGGAARPMAAPSPASVSASRRTRRRTFAGVAPSATRSAISRSR